MPDCDVKIFIIYPEEINYDKTHINFPSKLKLTYN